MESGKEEVMAKSKAKRMIVFIEGEVTTHKGLESILSRTSWKSVAQTFSKKTGETKLLLKPVD